MFVPSFLALWWPKIARKSGFPQLFAKTVGSIHFIPGIYTYGVSLWTPIDFRVRALIFGPLVAKNWPKIGVSATFRENCRLDSFHPWDLYLWGKSLDPYRFSCSCPHFWPSGGQKLTENRGFRNFSHQSGGILSPFMGTACFSRSSIKLKGHTAKKNRRFWPKLGFPDCNSSFNSPMAAKWCKKLNLLLVTLFVKFLTPQATFTSQQLPSQVTLFP